MKESFYSVKVEDAIQILKESIQLMQEAVKVLENLDEEIIPSTMIDYDNDITCGPIEKITLPHGVALIKGAKSIFYNEDTICPHLDLYSIVQTDKNNMIKMGQVRSLLLLSKRRGS